MEAMKAEMQTFGDRAKTEMKTANDRIESERAHVKAAYSPELTGRTNCP